MEQQENLNEVRIKKHHYILVKPKVSENEAITRLINRALDSDYEVLVKLR